MVVPTAMCVEHVLSSGALGASDNRVLLPCYIALQMSSPKAQLLAAPRACVRKAVPPTSTTGAQARLVPAAELGVTTGSAPANASYCANATQ